MSGGSVNVGVLSMIQQHQKQMLRQLTKISIAIAAVVTALFLSWSAVGIWAIAFHSGHQEISPQQVFFRMTCWEPTECFIEKYENTYTDWPGDGDCTLIARVPVDTLSRLMSRPGFTWRTLPLEPLLKEQVPYADEFDATHYRSMHVQPNDDWHRGSIVMVNAKTGLVLAYSWKH